MTGPGVSAQLPGNPDGTNGLLTLPPPRAGNPTHRYRQIRSAFAERSRHHRAHRFLADRTRAIRLEKHRGTSSIDCLASFE